MHVIGHQYISVDGTTELGCKFVKEVKIELVILLGMKAYRAVITALDDVPWDAGNREARATWHDVSTANEKDYMLAENRGLSPIISKIIVLNGVVSEIRYSAVVGRAPLDIKEMRHFEEIVSARADDIIAKWIDFFVLHKPITPERITRRLK
jgi:hypothetical protein